MNGEVTSTNTGDHSNKDRPVLHNSQTEVLQVSHNNATASVQQELLQNTGIHSVQLLQETLTDRGQTQMLFLHDTGGRGEQQNVLHNTDSVLHNNTETQLLHNISRTEEGDEEMQEKTRKEAGRKGASSEDEHVAEDVVVVSVEVVEVGEGGAGATSVSAAPVVSNRNVTNVKSKRKTG